MQKTKLLNIKLLNYENKMNKKLNIHVTSIMFGASCTDDTFSWFKLPGLTGYIGVDMYKLAVLLLFGVTTFLCVTLAFSDPLDLGMEKVDQAFEISCKWDRKLARKCQQKIAIVREKINTKFYFKKNPDRKQPYFQHQCKGYLKKLPIVYHKCASFLDTIEAKPAADESKLLEDEGKDYPFKGYAHCLLSVLRIESNGIMSVDPDAQDHFWNMNRKAFDKACAFSGPSLYRCRGQFLHMEKQLREQVKDEDRQIMYFHPWFHQVYDSLPPSYLESCGKFLEKKMSYSPAPADESEALKDDKNYYPFRALAHCMIHVLKRLTGGKTEKTTQFIAYGIEIVGKAFDKACTYEKTAWQCIGRHKFQADQILNRADFQGNPDMQEASFGIGTKQHVISYLSREYSQNCEKYLDKSEADPPSNESDVLQDTEIKAYPYKAYAHCLIATLKKLTGGKTEKTTQFIAYGIGIANKAHEEVCEKDKDNDWMRCQGMQRNIGNQILDHPQLKDKPELQESHFGRWTKENVIVHLANEYLKNCEKYLDDSEADPPSNESDFLKDTEHKAYPYKAYSHCLIATLKTKHGGKMPE